MVKFKMGDRFLTKTKTRPNMGTHIERMYIDLYNFQLPDICKEIISSVDDCEIVEGSIFKHRGTGNFLTFGQLSTSCRTLVGIAMETREDQPYFSNAYCGRELWDEWLPRLVQISNANILIENHKNYYTDDRDFLDHVFSMRLGRIYNSRKEISADYTAYCKEYYEAIEALTNNDADDF